jgi:transposase
MYRKNPNSYSYNFFKKTKPVLEKIEDISKVLKYMTKTTTD